jgi:hypothetical protein
MVTNGQLNALKISLLRCSSNETDPITKDQREAKSRYEGIIRPFYMFVRCAYVLPVYCHRGFILSVIQKEYFNAD